MRNQFPSCNQLFRSATVSLLLLCNIAISNVPMVRSGEVGMAGSGGIYDGSGVDVATSRKAEVGPTASNCHTGPIVAADQPAKSTTKPDNDGNRPNAGNDAKRTGGIDTAAGAVPSNSPEPIDDNDILEAVEIELRSDDVVSADQIAVRVNDGIVELSGDVFTLFAKQRAVQLVGGLKGVRSR